MNTTCDTRAELAVTNALLQLDVQPGQPVNLRRIEQLWSDYGIRASDLYGAIDRMVHGERLMKVRDADQVAIALTPAGQAWSRAQPAWLEYALLVPRRALRAERIRSTPRRSATAAARRGERLRSASAR